MAVGMHRLHPIDFWGQNAPRSSDLGSVPDEARIAGVTMGAKNGSASLSHMDVLVRADVLPDNFLLGRDLEEAGGTTLADERIAVGQALRAADVLTVERVPGIANKLPDDLLIGWSDLEDARKVASRTIVEQEDVPVLQHRSILLGRGRAGVEPGSHGTSCLIDDQHFA